MALKFVWGTIAFSRQCLVIISTVTSWNIANLFVTPFKSRTIYYIKEKKLATILQICNSTWLGEWWMHQVCPRQATNEKIASVTEISALALIGSRGVSKSNAFRKWNVTHWEIFYFKSFSFRFTVQLTLKLIVNGF